MGCRDFLGVAWRNLGAPPQKKEIRCWRVLGRAAKGLRPGAGGFVKTVLVDPILVGIGEFSPPILEPMKKWLDWLIFQIADFSAWIAPLMFADLADQFSDFEKRLAR